MSEYIIQPTNIATTPIMIEHTGNIFLYAHDDEMLRITPDGFYVRGVPVPQDAKEAENVYNAFVAWMAWAKLTQ